MVRWSHLVTRIALTMVAAAALLSGPSFADDKPKTTESERTGEHFRVICHFPTPDVAERALEIAEATWKVAAPVMRDPKAKLKAPIEIHLYRDSKAYQKAERKITKGKFAKSMAFSSHATKAAYLALQPDHPDAVTSRTGLSALTARQIAHEAAHLVVFWSVRSFANHPDWFAEGFAQHVAEQVSVDVGISPGPMDDPTSSSYAAAVQALIAKKQVPSIEEILSGPLVRLSANQRYGVWWLFYDFLSKKHTSRLKRMVARARKIGPGSTVGKQLHEHAEQIWGKRGLGRLQTGFEKFVNDLKPKWDQLNRHLGVDGTTWTQMAFGSNNAMAWRTEPVGKSRYSVTGSLEVLQGKEKQLNVLLGRNGNDFVMVAFSAPKAITLMTYTSSTNKWARIGSMNAEVFLPDTKLPFKIDVVSGKKKSTVKVWMKGAGSLSWDVPDRELTGPWGLGALAGSAGFWTDIQVK